MPLTETLLLAEKHLAARRYREAHAACMAVLQEDAGNAQAYYLLGILTSDHNNHGKAVELFHRALSNAPNHAAAHAQKARSLMALNQRGAALAAIRSAEALSPQDAFTLDTIGVVYSRSGLHEAALPFYERATDAAPGNAAYQYNYASTLQFLGKMDAARAAFRKAIAINPDDARSYAGIVQITKQTNTDNEISALERLFNASQDADTALIIGHAIAKAYEDMSDASQAFLWLTKAKAAKAKLVAHDRATDSALFETASALPAPHMNLGETGPCPIFITGMPRTGTTLVDRILSSHSAVTSAGELTDFSLVLKRAARTQGPFVLDTETLEAGYSINPQQDGQAYIARVEATLDLSKRRFTDKMPFNIFFAPHILQALPNARIIALKRHPADTVLSNFRQLFATSFTYYNYAYNLRDTAEYVIGFNKVLDHYQAILPADRFQVVSYENVVADIDAQTRRILAFCDLPFEQACIDFHQNKAPVATASSAQVREPLYTTAKGRWKRYQTDLKPALDLLIAAGLMTEDELNREAHSYKRRQLS